jgi:hypothetical protein
MHRSAILAAAGRLRPGTSRPEERKLRLGRFAATKPRFAETRSIATGSPRQAAVRPTGPTVSFCQTDQGVDALEGHL